MRGTSVELIIYNALSKMGFTSKNTLFAESTCPDEINHDDPN